MIFDKLSTYDKHKVFKNMLAPYTAVLIAQYFSLEYQYSAATICILSLESTRKASLRSSFERVLAASFGLILSACIIKFFHFNPISLVLFTGIFMPLCIRFNLMQGFFTNIVLATHFLLDKNVSLTFVFDQYLLLLVGVLCAIIFNLYMPSQNNEILSQLEKIDSIMKDIIFDFAKALKYKAVSLRQDELFEELKINLDNCKNLVEMEKDNNFFFKKVDISKNYSLKFSEYVTLLKIRECFNKISTDIPITSELASILKELATLNANTYAYNILLKKIKHSENRFKKEIDEKNLNIENKATYFLLIENIKDLIKIRIKNIF
ncbi:aromatic acid exporter family protein [Cetobacterium somerae]|uniref:aromatic acid exporter family protein n=1 Tax=Cetobacterium sp. NK01 TaxID=2993530 RepID=UPI0021168CD8|nr:aromatic acid exporter family protein [Cetobacterium sp. NK01]MCQ8212255.1 aromatic acid exporter family protein [Cetobacterium sp. NK01]